MDDSLLAEFQSTFLVAGDVQSSTHTHHPHFSLYKQHKEGYTNQEVRRKKILESQKSKRRDFMDYARRIVDGEVCEEMDEGMGGDEVDAGSEASGEAAKGKKKKKMFYPHKNQLMLSEWLVEVPEDFQDQWLMYVCPIGKRCLVISSKGTTCAYSRSGYCINNFPSLLPGGCAKTFHLARDYCILDCIYYEGTQTFYVLDMMCWGAHPVYDSDTEFRSFWKACKLKENADTISKFSRLNPLVFVDLPAYPCTRESLTQVLGQAWPVQVDGLLFIHKEAHYTPNINPLAVWLKAQMVTEILGLPVSQEFLACAPVLSEVKMDSTDGTSGKKKRNRSKSKKKVDASQQGMEVSTSDCEGDMATECPVQTEN